MPRTVAKRYYDYKGILLSQVLARGGQNQSKEFIACILRSDA